MFVIRTVEVEAQRKVRKTARNQRSRQGVKPRGLLMRVSGAQRRPTSTLEWRLMLPLPRRLRRPHRLPRPRVARTVKVTAHHKV